MLPSHMGKLLSAERADCDILPVIGAHLHLVHGICLRVRSSGCLYKKYCGVVNYCVQDKLFGGVTRFITEAVPKSLHSTAIDTR